MYFARRGSRAPGVGWWPSCNSRKTARSSCVALVTDRRRAKGRSVVRSPREQPTPFVGAFSSWGFRSEKAIVVPGSRPCTAERRGDAKPMSYRNVILMGELVDSLARRSKESHSRPMPTWWGSSILPHASSHATVIMGNPSSRKTAVAASLNSVITAIHPRLEDNLGLRS